MSELEIIPTEAELVKREPPPPDALMRLIERAVMTPDFDVVKLEKLFEVKAKWDALEARRAFVAALSEARAKIKPIKKLRTVEFEAKDKTKADTHYKHEALSDIADAIDPILAQHGLSYRYVTNAAPGQPISVTCIIAHRLGHEEQNTITAIHDASGNKNPIQAMGSTVTYLQRYTLKAALGLAAAYDDDGKAAGKPLEEDLPITDAQIGKLKKMLDEDGADVAKFCEYFEVDNLAEIPASRFDQALKTIEARRKQMKRKGAAA